MAVTPVTTLSDVLVAVRALLIAVGDVRADSNLGGVELLFGERYLKQEGSPPRIVFVREDGDIGPVLAVGARQVNSITETVRCYVWGAETSDDVDRQRAAEALAHRLLNAFKATAPGRLAGKVRLRNSDTNVVTYGEELVLDLAYSYGVPYDDAIWDAAYAAAPDPALSPPDPDRPQGDTGDTFTVIPTLEV